MYKDYAKIRNQQGLSDYLVSKETGVATATLTAWKNGSYTPKIEKLIKIAKFLDTNVEDLIPEKF